MAMNPSSPTGAPNPAPSTDERTYQSRLGVSPTTTPNLSFNNSKENGDRALYQGHIMGYTGINGHEPSAMEKGVPSDQARKGASGESLKKIRR